MRANRAYSVWIQMVWPAVRVACYFALVIFLLDFAGQAIAGRGFSFSTSGFFSGLLVLIGIGIFVPIAFWLIFKLAGKIRGQE